MGVRPGYFDGTVDHLISQNFENENLPASPQGEAGKEQETMEHRKKLSREMMHRLMESEKVEYNPVVFYGSETACSLIADEIEEAQRKKFPNREIYRTDPDQFYRDMIVSVATGSRTVDEANEVRKADVLIFENVHLLSRRPESEERFYFLFDSFYESGKQIIITSGCAPSETDGLDNRIRTQLEGGLMINVRYE